MKALVLGGDGYDQYYYNAAHTKLLDLYLESHYLGNSILDSIMKIAIQYNARIDPDVVMPGGNWKTDKAKRRINQAPAESSSLL